MSDHDKGLYNKYRVINRETGKEAVGSYFVLRPDKDAAARPALLRYAEETAARNDELSADLWKWIQSIDAYAECPEDVYPLLDGGEIILAPGDRVLFQRSRPEAMPLTIDADSIIDDVLQAYKASLLQLGQVSRERDEWYSSYLQAVTDTDSSSDMLNALQDHIADLERGLDEAREDLECLSAKTSPESLGYGVKWKRNAIAAREERDKLRHELTELQQVIVRAIRSYETGDMETDFGQVLDGIYETLKGVAAVEEGGNIRP